ncbi:uncharacterized protein TRIREDRAFT_67509 [Trichoderma reesei QM6a]|uniref:Predicted protein n=2 Tax=Hypocrea jecorina TaxID=51453 RepID=G0RSN9_HYPJQ|nr:uncharacterized protein TRIREDRAFT_67509 [Trichoderma reesei QM6a]EGR45868.1 predicted protein [Trichoderma reesei QM6a]ETR99018.1 hypothetical protein M419DRAFT_87383 [Trichoderma reesei RUT C-30]
MHKVKKAVGDLISKDGKHDTTVDEEVRQPVTNEHVRPHEQEHVRTAVEKDIHQDHHHTVVQPLEHKEVLPEKHHERVLPTEHRSFDHGSDKDVHNFLERDAAKYKDASVTHHKTHETHTEAPIIAGERVHHHVHEHIQPVIHKETVAPEVIHTTVPVHETHQAAAVHHGTKVLPTKTLSEFTGGQGLPESRESRMKEQYEGCPTFDGKDLESGRTEGNRTAGDVTAGHTTAGNGTAGNVTTGHRAGANEGLGH